MDNGKLILVPTPIQEGLPLEPTALEMIKSNLQNDKVIFCVEDIKPARKRWLQWGLPREKIDELVCFNEHTQEDLSKELIQKLKCGYIIFIMSDGGLPAFCDPGQKFLKLCHHNKIKVTSTPFPNSIALALALSGIEHNRFYFAGFPPRQKEARESFLKELTERNETIVLMDAPYRMSKLCQELSKMNPSQYAFLAIELNGDDEKLIYGKIGDLATQTSQQKAEFILILDSAKRK